MASDELRPWRPRKDTRRARSDRSPDDQRPEIDVGNRDLPAIAKMAWDAVVRANDPPWLFKCDSGLCRIESHRDGSTSLRQLDMDTLQHALARAAYFVRAKDGVSHSAYPPRPLVADMLACPDPLLPYLARLTEGPCFTADGRLLARSGFDAASGIHLTLAQDLTIEIGDEPPHPDEVDVAVHFLLTELLGDFPFEADSDRAHAVAAMLLPLVRSMIDGPTPLHLIDKPAPGAGASLLADVIALIATGRPAAALTESGDEDETRKRVTSKLRLHPIIVLFDNLRRRLDSAAIAAALTATAWEDRQLGSSTIIRVPVHCLWLATGNNVALSNEIARRTVRLRLDPGVERPWTRTGFRHPDLRGWVKANRGKIIEALITLVTSWQANKPAYDGPRLGSYESWSSVIGGILRYAGIPGFLANSDRLYQEADAEGQSWVRFVAAWHERHGTGEVTAKDLYDIAVQLDPPFDKFGRGNEQAQRTALGKALSRARDRVMTVPGGATVRITIAGERQNATIWQLRATPPREGGEGREVNPPPGGTA